MIYRLTGGNKIGQIINDKQYSVLEFYKKCLFEPVTDIDSYEFKIFITTKLSVIQHVFDFEDEVEQFIRESGHFLIREIHLIRKAIFDDHPILVIETPVCTIKYTRKL